MKTQNATEPKTAHGATLAMAALLATTILAPQLSTAQGTTSFTFEGQPYGTTSGTIGVYTESGMQFGMAYGPGNLYLSGGGGASSYPQNGTGYLEAPDGVNARLEFGYNAFPQTSPIVPFNLISFDAAEFPAGPTSVSQTIEVIGYKPMAGTVTNYFTIDSLANRRANSLPDFQTLYLDSAFNHVFAVDVLNARWCLDNVVISGVPEPSALAIAATAVCCTSAYRRITRRKKPQKPKA